MTSRLTVDIGLVGRVSVALALLLAVRGVWIAVRRNERYLFFTWRVWSLVWPLLAIGVALQAAFWLMR
jgi:hypothetical protein